MSTQQDEARLLSEVVLKRIRLGDMADAEESDAAYAALNRLVALAQGAETTGAADGDGVRVTHLLPAAEFNIALDTRHRLCHEAADAFWAYWKENGETHKRGYYESTWGAINRALRLVGVRPHDWGDVFGKGATKYPNKGEGKP